MSESDGQGRSSGRQPASIAGASAPEPDSVVWLVDDAGQDHPHELLEVLDVGDYAYAALLVMRRGAGGRAELNPDRTEMTFLRIEMDDDGEEILVEIEDRAEVEAVFAAWTAWLDAMGL